MKSSLIVYTTTKLYLAFLLFTQAILRNTCTCIYANPKSLKYVLSVLCFTCMSLTITSVTQITFLLKQFCHVSSFIFHHIFQGSWHYPLRSFPSVDFLDQTLQWHAHRLWSGWDLGKRKQEYVAQTIIKHSINFILDANMLSWQNWSYSKVVPSRV